MLNDLSFLIILSLISLPLPGPVSPIQEAILSFIYLDLFQTDDWLPPAMFSKAEEDKDQGLNRVFEVNSYSSTKAVKNMGSTALYVGAYILMQIIYAITLGLSKMCEGGRIERAKTWMGQRLYWNTSIRFYI